MSVGEVGVEDGERDLPAAIEAELQAGEEVRRSWTAGNVHWANQWQVLPDSPTHFAATDRRVVFATGDETTSIGYNHVRAVETDPADDGMDLSVAFRACGGLCLVVGVVAATRDLTNGAGLVALSVLLLAAGGAVGTGPDRATVTIVIDNERQRLSFSADESVGEALAELATEG
ncbi:hypothetical protein M0R88_15150 [Halorussus gelatinilyticus]|uniref:Uncharacterized protein n=1 Tax=Halorussus gelatinilyticus TaxID=2937524 RepID=A0A8U0IFT4_9EURY|nr:hypothetical protein [Halorussus gelatinilyticus]UPV99842.1 hypothetical protein M0R88_15150 [Halorussus gelatinilyticus]